MDALQIVSSATQIVSTMLGAVSALEQASTNLNEAPKRIRTLEEFVSNLESLAQQLKQKYAHKAHNAQLDHQINGLNGLIDRLNLNVAKARRLLTKSKMKGFSRVVWSSMVGDPVSKYIQLIRDDLNWWLELQKLTESVESIIASTSENVSSILRIKSEQGYPVSNKCHYVRELLEKDDTRPVVLIVGLSGIGKSCLARQIASDPPSRFVDGAVELGFGRWCSRAACNGSRSDYRKRLVKKICRFLVQIGSLKKARDELNEDLEDVCCLLQMALVGKSMLILLDDVWEQDIVDRFAKLYDNDCRYLVTTRDEAVYEITEAEKVEICKDDIKEISKEILLYHTMLSDEELPAVAENLLDRCGHHPLTVAVMGKTLRKETSVGKWERAISDLSTHATCAPGPVPYVNEKEVETTLTIFGSFEFSLEAMPEHSRRFFVLLAAISWAEPVPEACVEALWSVLRQDSLFPLVVCKLVEGSLLIKLESQLLYHVHDMVSLYLDNKTSEAMENLLVKSSHETAALIAPWLLIFGKETVQDIAEEKLNSFLTSLQDREVVMILKSTIHSLMASKSISQLEASRLRFSRVITPRISELISVGSPNLLVSASKAITIIFIQEDYCVLAKSLEEKSSVDKLLNLFEDSNDISTVIAVSTVVAKLAEFASSPTIDKILTSIPMNQIAEFLSADAEEWHDNIFMTILSLTKAGKSKAVEMMIESGVDKKLLTLLENGSEIAQHHSIVTLKTFYELGGPLEQGCLKPGTLNHLPWHVRLSLERLVLSDRNISPLPKSQAFEALLSKILTRDSKEIVEALQGLIPIVEKAGDERIRDLILGSQLIERLVVLLQHGGIDQTQARSESAFLVMKLACSGGEPFIRRFLELDIVLELVKMMQCNIEELQDSAYTALHQIIFAKGGSLVVNKILQLGLIEKLVNSLERKCLKTKEVSLLFIVDIVEAGSKPCIEKMLSSQVVEKLVGLDKMGGNFSGAVLRFIKGLDMCKNLSSAERQVMKQQVMRKVRSASAVRGHKIEASLIASVESDISEGSRGGCSSKRKK
ncbi:Apoptotic protease-activating factor 1 [Ananas comosus]|uniref:Apoptotic protease-activating factor 1 n=1 Tax=Ananas comosus TaxID=4615 RepID=A0A199W0Z4_ANACO|nr:Apoptotic protease-activating factor 1 [Ananas comosus]